MTIVERWAVMPKVYDVEDRAHKLRIGERTWDIPVFLLDQDGIDRIRLGYICIACLERHPVPYPERCALDACSFPIRAHQDEVFERLYLGEVEIGPQTSLEDEFAWAREKVARDRHRKGPTIWVPGRDGD